VNALSSQHQVQLPTDLASMAIVASRFDECMRLESLDLVLQCFERVSTLESFELLISLEYPQARFGALSYASTCSVVLMSHTPSVLMLPQLDRNAQMINVVAHFWKRGGRTDQEFQSALGGYFNEVWPAFNDRSHLFDGVGSLRVNRKDITHMLNVCDPEERRRHLRTLVA